jgi:hypothetical protein
MFDFETTSMLRRPSAPVSTITVLGIIVLGHAAASTAGDIDKRCLADLMENGPPAWKKVASFVENVGVTCQERRVDHQQEGPKTVATEINSDWSLCWNRQSATRLLERRAVGSDRRRLNIVNPKYRFVLVQPREGDSFQLESGNRFSPGRLQSYDLTEEGFRDRLEAGIRVYGIRLEDLLSDKEFRLDRINYIPDSNAADKRVLIEWRYLGSEGGRTRRAGGIYAAELNPNNAWQVDWTEVRIPARSDWGGWRQEVTYQTTDALVPFPATIRVSFSLQHGKLKVESVNTFGKPTTCQRSEQEFFLPYYGIPENALGLPGGSPWPRWLVYGGSLFGLALVGFLARSWLRRKGTAM